MAPTPLKKNISILKTKDSKLAKKLCEVQPSEDYSVISSKSGKPTVVWIKADGTRKNLHSSYDPVHEASRFINSIRLNESLNYIVGGIGLGYHLMELVRRVPQQARIFILEKDLRLLRLAFENNDFSEILSHPGVSIHVGVNEAQLEKAFIEDRIGFALNGYTPVSFNPVVNVDRQYYESLNKTFQEILQETRLDLKTQTAFSKIFFRNILENLPYSVKTPGIRSLEKAMIGVPAIIISAGPSLDKNIALLKGVMNRVLLISVATALKPILACGIAPDFVVAIDPDDTTIKAFDLSSPPQETWLLYDPCIPYTIVKNFKCNRLVFDSTVYLAQWIARNNEEKGSLGKTLSVAHTGFLFAKHLGCDPIIFVGQDLAFLNNRLHCSGSFFEENQRDQITYLALSEREKQNFEKYGKSLAPANDIFGNVTSTTIAMDSYKNIFAKEIKTSKSIFNATEGGVTIPGVENFSLKEVLTLYCKQDQRLQKRRLLKRIKNTNNVEKLSLALEKISKDILHLHCQMKDLKQKYLSSSSDQKSDYKNFTDEMDSLYKVLLRNEEILQLLQGYSYSDFLQWNHENQNLYIKKEAGEPDYEKSKYERDKKFLKVLTNTAKSVSQAFDKVKEKFLNV